MAYNEDLANRIREQLAEAPVTERKMFGGLCFMVGGHMTCGIVGDALMLRLGEEAADAALDEPYTRPMDLTGRPMKNMLYVDPPGVATDEALGDWIARARAFVATLPPRPH